MASYRGSLDYIEQTVHSLDPEFRGLQNAATFADTRAELVAEHGALHRARQVIERVHDSVPDEFDDVKHELEVMDDIAYQLFDDIWDLDRPIADTSDLKRQLLALRAAVTKMVDDAGDIVVGEKALSAGRRRRKTGKRKSKTRRRRYGFA